MLNEISFILSNLCACRYWYGKPRHRGVILIKGRSGFIKGYKKYFYVVVAAAICIVHFMVKSFEYWGEITTWTAPFLVPL